MRLLLLLVALMVSSCGFHLRGTQSMEASLSDIYIVSADRFGSFYQNLVRTFNQSDIAVTDSPAESEYQLTIGRERNTKRAIGTTKTISVAEYEIRVEVSIGLLSSSGEVVIPQTIVGTERTYRFDSVSLVGSNAEEALLLEEMKIDLVAQILRRVDASVRTYRQTQQ